MTDDEGKITAVHLDREGVEKLERLAVAKDRSRSRITRRLIRSAPRASHEEPPPKYERSEAGDGWNKQSWRGQGDRGSGGTAQRFCPYSGIPSQLV